MKIGIIVAMESELAMLLPLVDNMTETAVNGHIIRRGRMGDNEVALMPLPKGKTACAKPCAPSSNLPWPKGGSSSSNSSTTTA